MNELDGYYVYIINNKTQFVRIGSIKHKVNTYSDIIIDKYKFLEDKIFSKNLEVIKTLNKEYNEFITKNKADIEQIKEKCKNILSNYKEEHCITTSNNFVFCKVNKNNIMRLYLLDKKSNSKFLVFENGKYLENSYFGDIVIDKHIVYTVDKKYDDNQTLFIIKEDEIRKAVYEGYVIYEGEVVEDGGVDIVSSKYDVVVYNKRNNIIIYDVKTGSKQVIFKNTNKNFFIDNIYISECGNLIHWSLNNYKERIMFLYYKNEVYEIPKRETDKINLKIYNDSVYLELIDEYDNSCIYKTSIDKLLSGSYLEDVPILKSADILDWNINKKYFYYIKKTNSGNYLYYTDLSLKAKYDSILLDDDYITFDNFYDENIKLEKLGLFRFSKKTIYTSKKNNEKTETFYRFNVNVENYVVLCDEINGIKIYTLASKKYSKPRGVMLYVYGAYNVSLAPRMFSEIDYLYADMGLYSAYVFVRGGGENNFYWYENGKMLYKMNTIHDTIVATKYIKSKYGVDIFTGIEGKSAGGIAVGGAIAKQPDLYHVAILDSAYLDVLTTIIQKPNLLTFYEHNEFGDVYKPVFYYYVKEYCPYYNLKTNVYPDMLIIVGTNDRRVEYTQGIKFYLKTKEHAINEPNILCKITNLGHFPKQNIEEYSEYIAEKIAFVKESLSKFETS